MLLLHRITSTRRTVASVRLSAAVVGVSLISSATVLSPASANDDRPPASPVFASTSPSPALPSVVEGGSTANSFDADGVPPTSQGRVFGHILEAAGEDQLFVVDGTADGVVVLSSRADEDYAWTEFAKLDVPTIDTDLWLTNSCVTSSGNFMAIAFAPRSATNDEAQFKAGAWAAVVDLRTGEVSSLGAGFTLAYFSPGCGAYDTFALTRYEPNEAITRVAVVNAADATVVAKYAIEGEAHSATSSANGTAFVVSEGNVLRLQPNGKRTVIARPDRRVYDLTADERGRIGFVEVDEGGATASAFVLNANGNGAAKEVAHGATHSIGMREDRGGNLLVTGASLDAGAKAVPGLTSLRGAERRAFISSARKIIVNEVSPSSAVGAASPGAASSVFSENEHAPAKSRLHGTVVDTDEDIEFILGDLPRRANQQSSAGGAEATAREVRGSSRGFSRQQLLITSVALDTSAARVPATVGSPHDPVESERYCAVPRNDPNNQAYQPKPRQVEWAVDRAVKGQLTETRPSNWRNLGMAAYSPQAMFPPVTLAGGGTMPPQIVLGVLMQESNMWQASRYTAPGNTGNPLIGDYYGNRASDPYSIWDIDYPESDCGYGVGQITDGMRLAGHERTNPITGVTETALPYAQQRAIALDYEANIAMTVRKLGQKWNELAAAGMLINNGDPTKIENWFFAVWAYNTGFYPYSGSANPWGVGWTNNPVSNLYPAGRYHFLTFPSDAAHPQDWPYPEKIIGWAAYGTSLVETQYADAGSRSYVSSYVSSYRTAWWTSTSERDKATPAYYLFCDPSVNDCDPWAAEPCLRAGTDYKCWWHGPVTWKPNCAALCGSGFERFPSSYATEASSMSASLPALTLQSSHRADCNAPPTGVVVVDDTTHLNARNPGECTHRTTAGAFEFTFSQADSSGHYPAKVDLHQQGGGFNGHFYFAHMEDASDLHTIVSGTWSRGASLDGSWARVWVHVPDYAAWTQQAAYVIDLGDGTTVTRYLQQRRYQNEWVSLGVFQMRGEPTVTLTNELTREFAVSPPPDEQLAGFDDVAWDAVGFETLAHKPDNFVVTLGDSYGAGEAAGDYAPWSDNNGHTLIARNACHQSANSWIRKTILAGQTQTIGALADSRDVNLDLHTLACSGARSEHILPYYSIETASPPRNGDDRDGRFGQYGMLSQIDEGYLDENTTLVALSIGGNDMRFADIVSDCTMGGDGCRDRTIDDDDGDPNDIDSLHTISIASQLRLEQVMPTTLTTVIAEIRSRAPNARIAVFGYPRIFQSGASCLPFAPSLYDSEWLDAVGVDLNDTIETTVNAYSDPDVFYVSLDDAFDGEGVCGGNGAISGIVLSNTPGDSGDIWGTGWGVSQQSLHPTSYGTDLYAQSLMAALAANP